MKVTGPAVRPVTIPPFVILATALLLDIQVPPLVGNKEVVFPMQISLGPVSMASGLSAIFISCEESDRHPVKDSVYLK